MKNARVNSQRVIGSVRPKNASGLDEWDLQEQKAHQALFGLSAPFGLVSNVKSLVVRNRQVKKAKAVQREHELVEALLLLSPQPIAFGEFGVDFAECATGIDAHEHAIVCGAKTMATEGYRRLARCTMARRGRCGD